MSTPPPASLPAAVAAAVRSVEAELADAMIEAAAWSWTLTYLEGQPVVELDDGTRIRYLAQSQHAVITSADLDDRDAQE